MADQINVHVVGDEGRRYEVTFFNPATRKRQVLCWADTREAAQRLVDGINKHPAWEQPSVEDRNPSSA